MCEDDDILDPSRLYVPGVIVSRGCHCDSHGVVFSGRRQQRGPGCIHCKTEHRPQQSHCLPGQPLGLAHRYLDKHDATSWPAGHSRKPVQKRRQFECLSSRRNNSSRTGRNAEMFDSPAIAKPSAADNFPVARINDRLKKD